MVVDLTGKVRVVLIGRFEYHLIHFSICYKQLDLCVADLRSIGELVRRKVDLAEGPFADETTQCIIPYVPKLFRREFPVGWTSVPLNVSQLAPIVL